MFINWKLREINLKIVYYGPALSGKTTTLEYIHLKTNPQLRGDLVSLKTRGDRTIYFDFMQLKLGEISGLKPRFNIYTVPGQVYYVGTRKIVLKGADGVVFVADSQADRLQANIKAAQDMKANLHQLGLEPAKMPLVLQCNKQDLSPLTPVSKLKRKLNMPDTPTFETIATEGEGVLDGFKTIVNRVVTSVQQKI
jgi:hypothetical protein